MSWNVSFATEREAITENPYREKPAAGVPPLRLRVAMRAPESMARQARSRVKAIVGQVPAISGKDSPVAPVPLRGRALEDAIKRARTGQGGEFETGFSARRMIDVETNQMVAEYRPFQYLKAVGDRPVLLIPAEKDELINNKLNAYAAMEVLTGPKKLIEVPGITHFEMYINEAFEISSNAAANWFREHLGLEQKKEAARNTSN